MDELGILRDLVIIFAVAVVIVALVRRLGVPSITGFILAGMLVGPRAAGFIADTRQVELLAEVGVALLLFGIGLELSLERLRRLWQAVIVGGVLQVGITLLATVLAATKLGLNMRSSIFIGCLAAVSSTAIVLRGLESRGELDAPHGRLTLGILVFQDLCVIPMMLAIPLLAGSHTSTAGIVETLAKAIAVMVGVVVAGRFLVPQGLHIVARTRQRELFVLAVFLICIGTAWIASTVGISLALGAFLAGLVVAGSEYQHQALADVVPFREMMTSIFFVSIGMLLDPRALWFQAVPVGGIVAAILVGKFAVVFIVGALMRLPLRVCILAGAALAQVGEFSFVLMHAAGNTELLAGPLAENLSAAAIVSMVITPLALAVGPHIAAGAGKLSGLTRLLDVRTAPDAEHRAATWSNHLIIAGYGVAGQTLARSLRSHKGIPYLVVDLNPENVRLANANGDSAYYGDVTSPEILQLLDAPHALELVVVINDPGAALRAVRSARKVAPNLHIIVRTRYVADTETLLEAGATRVVPEELEATVEVVHCVLGRYGVSPARIEEELLSIRGRQYPLS